jgi:hypothetical protein
MMTITEIEEAVASLPTQDLKKFRSWFDSFDSGLWDKQFEKDVNTGTLDLLAEEAESDYQSGKCTEL